MADSVVSKIKDAFEGIAGDKKTIIRILSVLIILLLALILRTYDKNRADVVIEAADNAEEIEYNEEEVAGEAQSGAVIFVDIGGAVKKPGVYQVSKDTRLFEVIDMAEGLSEDADTDHVNRASFVEDGQKIIIPVKGSDEAADMTSVSSAGASDSSSGLININTATSEELQTLNGIGSVMAERIIEYRSSNAFKSKEDVMSVDGIGSKTYEKIADDITV